ncbi:MAG: hypothetical protein P8188_09435 [Gemmatimonadota bacterium]
MLEFFRSDPGRLVLLARDLADDFDTFEAASEAERKQEGMFQTRKLLFRAYFDATGIVPDTLGPDDPSRVAAPDPEMRLAHYLVESHRLSRNPALTRVIFATADTLLEFGAEHAQLFTRHPPTRELVRTFLQEFAVKVDFDDESADFVARRLLGATVAAVAEHPGDLAREPALGALFAALGSLKADFQDDFVARIVSVDGFERLVGTYLVHVGADPSFITEDERLAEVLGAVLTKIGTDFQPLLDDPGAFVGVLEVALVSGSGHVRALLQAEVEDEPLLGVVLFSLLDQLEAAAAENALFARIADGQVVSELYRATLESVAADPSLVGTTAATDDFVAGLVSAVAGALATRELEALLSEADLRRLGVDVLSTLANRPQALVGDNAFAGELLAAVLRAGVTVMGENADPAELAIVVEAALEAALDNVALLSLDDRLGAVLGGLATALGAGDLRRLRSPALRRQALMALLDVVSANPALWRRFAENDLVEALAAAVVDALEADPTRLVTGSILVGSLRNLLMEAARRGQPLIDGDVPVEAIHAVLAAALDRAQEEIGRGLDGPMLPGYLAAVLRAFLTEPVDVSDPEPLEEFLDAVLQAVRAEVT